MRLVIVLFVLMVTSACMPKETVLTDRNTGCEYVVNDGNADVTFTLKDNCEKKGN